MPNNIREVRDMMQANMLQHDRQRRNQRTRSRRWVQDITDTRGNAPSATSSQEAPPPVPYGMGESTFQRQQRTRPGVDIPIVRDVEFTQCPVCLQEFQHRDIMWRLQCGHQYHKDCWERNSRTHIHNGIRGAPNEAPCAVCRGVGIIVAEYPYAGTHEPEAALHTLTGNSRDILELRQQIATIA